MTDTLRERVVAAIGHQYEVESEIGRGGMSVVYRARDVRLNRAVAIKVLPPEMAYDPAIRTRFTREAQTSAQLTHPHIVPIFDVGERNGLAYFVMALVSGGDLAELLAREPKLPIDEVRRLLCEIADALAFAHLRGVIHRDIKPDNVLLDRDTGRVMVTDFGIARAIEAGTRLTVTGNAVGTPTYMSPEQALGEKDVDGRSDIYSLGVLAYQMLTGRVPFTAGNSMALLLKHVQETPRSIAELRPEAPKILREAIERALSKAPEDRWPTAAALRDVLLSERAGSASWRAENREPVKYVSPRPDNNRGDARAASRRAAPSDNAAPIAPPVEPVLAGGLVLEPAHLASLTPEQRRDLRLWHGRVNLRDRIKAMRGYVWLTVAAVFASIGAVGGGIEAEIPPLVLAPLVPMYMMVKTWRRGKSLRESGLRLRRVLFMPRARWVIPTPKVAPREQQLAALVPREVLESPQGVVLRRAVDERAAILDIVAALPKADRAMISDVEPTAKALVERVAQIAKLLHRLDTDVDPRAVTELDARIAAVRAESATPDGERRLTLMRRQRDTLQDLVQRRAALAQQIESAALALGNLRLDLIKLRSSGLQSALGDVSMATQEARALSRDIDTVLDAAAEVKGL